MQHAYMSTETGRRGREEIMSSAANPIMPIFISGKTRWRPVGAKSDSKAALLFIETQRLLRRQLFGMKYETDHFKRY